MEEIVPLPLSNGEKQKSFLRTLSLVTFYSVSESRKFPFMQPVSLADASEYLRCPGALFPHVTLH